MPLLMNTSLIRIIVKDWRMVTKVNIFKYNTVWINEINCSVTSIIVNHGILLVEFIFITSPFAENDDQDLLRHGSTALSWVNSVAVCRSSDLAASGAGNGSVRLWAIENESKGIHPLFELPLVVPSFLILQDC